MPHSDYPGFIRHTGMSNADSWIRQMSLKHVWPQDGTGEKWVCVSETQQWTIIKATAKYR